MKKKLCATLIAALVLTASSALAADRIRLAVQKTGTLAWELEIMKAHGLDKKANLDIQALELATPEAGKIAIKGGSVDMFLSDWLWAARERSLGDTLVFYPSSSTVGAVMAKADSPIQTVADLKGKKLAVAGGPLDKSWLLLQALARRSGVDLRKESTIVYGAPPLLSQKALQGENDGTLTFWNFCAELEGKGMKRAIVMDDVMKELGAKDAVAILGFVFDSKFAERNRSAVDRFLGAIREAKEILGDSESDWLRLAPRIGVSDPKGLAIYRERYREGIPHRPVADEEADARRLYQVLAEVGGTDLVGTAKELDKGTFYKPATGF